jgi:hypothetical protein
MKKRRTSSKKKRLSSQEHSALHGAWKDQKLVLFLGAGVSLEYGLPAWRNLVLELLFEHVADGSPLRQIAINYRRAVSDWLADYFAYGPVVLARLIEDFVAGTSGLPGNQHGQARTEFLKLLQEGLYSASTAPPNRTSLRAIADLVARKSGNIPAIVSFNFDDLLEQELTRRKVRFNSVYAAGRVDHGVVPIIHAHGFIPQKGEPPSADIVFTERDYHTLTEGVFHWALTEIIWYLRHHTVLFIGLSMSDPSLRRLLDAAVLPGRVQHFQLQRRHQVPTEKQPRVLQELESSAKLWKTKFGSGQDKAPHQLLHVLETALHQADQFDTQLFQKMGVNTIWIEDFAHIPDILDEIAVKR